jgi:hypothetical protein
MRRGKHSHALKQQSKVAWLPSEWQTERVRTGRSANQLRQQRSRLSISRPVPVAPRTPLAKRPDVRPGKFARSVTESLVELSPGTTLIPVAAVLGPTTFVDPD